MDGPGGAGKTTQVAHLSRYLTACGYPVHTTTEPSHAPLGEIARHQTETYCGHALACLVTADRYHHLATDILPNLAAGKIVICDRYVASSYVLQRMDGVSLSFIEALNADTYVPDLAVILTTDPEIAATRIAQRGAHTRFEAGIETSRSETGLCRDTADYLAALGYPVVTIDTSHIRPDRLAAQIGTRIASLARVHGLASAAG